MTMRRCVVNYLLQELCECELNLTNIFYMFKLLFIKNSRYYYLCANPRNIIFGQRIGLLVNEQWISAYNDEFFYRLFRLNKLTFNELLHEIVNVDKNYGLILKKYRGGNIPVQPETALLIFLWYMSQQDTLQSISFTFKVATSTVMNIVNSCLYLLLKLKNKYIYWPKTVEEYRNIEDGFHNYPGNKYTSHMNIVY